MSPRKLTDSDKKEILTLYRNSLETTSSLALRYGVSSSTVSRFLKNQLSESEYEDLIQKKRLARTPKGFETLTSQPLSSESEVDLEDAEFLTSETVEENSSTTIDEGNSLISRRRRRSSVVQVQDSPEENSDAVVSDLDLDIHDITESEEKDQNEEFYQEDEDIAVTLLEMLGEDMDTEENEDDLDDLDDLDDEDDEDDEDDVDTQIPWVTSNNSKIQVLPISEASFPNPCYLVIDRASELITRPLKEFGDLGRIPEQEILQKTLPIFDNHRVARRFSNRSQRVIKVPNGQMLEKTCSHLKAKGITRMFMDGQIYSF
jgi:transposase-like protein